MTRPVFLAPGEDLRAATPGARLRLTGAEAHHAATVRRLRVGEELDLVDGAGRRVTGTAVSVAKDLLVLEATAVTDEPEPRPRLVLVQALAKGGRDEQAVEQSTELGVDAVVPWQAERCVSRWDAKAAKGRARWESVALAAAKQSRRARVPEVADVRTTARLAEDVTDAVAAGAAVLVLHESATTRLAELAPELADPAAPPGEVWCVVGPEGGISEAELDLLTTAGARAVLLGPHVLRSSTAGPAAVAALSVALHRW